MTARIWADDAGTRVETDTLTVVYMLAWPYGTGQLCPNCGCCAWEPYDRKGDGVCVGHCEHPEGADHPVVLQRYCPACLGEHHGWVCPELTTTGQA